MPPLKIINETEYDGRSVAACVRHVFRELDLTGDDAMVKIKMLRQRDKCYSGRFYANPHYAGGAVYDFDRKEFREIRVNVPSWVRHLIVCRIGSPDFYPRQNYVYKRKDSPGTWLLEDWREALVSVCGHEAMHLKQKLTPARGRGRYNEVDTEWAGYRMWLRWRER